MKFRFVCIFIATLAGVLNVAFASYVQNLDSSDTISTRLAREVISIDEQRNKCYQEYSLKTDDFLAQVKNRSLDCDHVTESAKSQFDLLNGNAREVFQSFVQDKVKSTQDGLLKCSEKKSAADYFQCVKSFETSQREFLNEINEKSRRYVFELEKIEEDERFCVNKAVDESKSNAASLNLRRCLVKISEPTSTSTTPETFTTPIPLLSAEVTGNITRLKRVYFETRHCMNNAHDQDKYQFNTCLDQTIYVAEMKDYWSKYMSEYFHKLNEIDKTEDICLRHLLAHIIVGKGYDGQLFPCFKKGRANSTYCETIDDDMIKYFEMFSKALHDCKYVDSSETKECVDRALSDLTKTLDSDCYSILDESIETIIASVYLGDDEERCFRFALKKFQFDGLFLKNSDKKGFKQCYYN